MNNAKSNTLKASGFYQTKEWRKARKLVLQRDHYLCQLCIAKNCARKANTVHHIKALEDYPSLALDLANLTSCCYACHELTKVKESERSRGVRIIKM